MSIQVQDVSATPLPESLDEIDAALPVNGGIAPDLQYLTDLSRRIGQIEWVMARRQSGPAAQPESAAEAIEAVCDDEAASRR